MKIISFEVNNFRSLKELKVPELSETTIFYGENNAGKSNLLNILQLIFQRKAVKENPEAPVTFYNGIISNSQSDYFNNNTSEPISFQITVSVKKNELSITPDIESLFDLDSDYLFTFIGKIDFINGDDYSEMNVVQISANQSTIYSRDTESVAYFPDLNNSQKRQSELGKAFTQLIDLFNDCVYVVNSDRDMHESQLSHEKISDLKPQTFKKYLYTLYLSKKDHHLFENIDNVFSSDPFRFGHLSFADENGKLEIMVKENGFRLPIKHLGSGVLQALYIITSIVKSKSKIVCLEELEQNLSPKKQFEILKKLQGMINEDGISLNQLILTSHSSVYSKPKLGTIYFLEKKDGSTQIIEKEKEKLSAQITAHLSPSFIEMTEEEKKMYLKEVEEMHDLK